MNQMELLQPYVISVILNSNRREDTLSCIESLLNSTYSNHKVIVLDNRSTDGSIDAIRIAFPSVQIIDLLSNMGYAGNNNVGIKAAIAQKADWIFILNEDTILHPECIKELVKFGESDEKIGIVGPLVYHHDEPDCIQSAGGKLDQYWDSWHIAQNQSDIGQIVLPHTVDFISGCAIMVRNAIIKQIGLIDERFFLYKEEAEWCLRARKSGWRVTNIPSAKIWHKGVQREYRPKPYVTYYKTRNWFLLLSTHHAPLSVYLGAWLQSIRTIISWTIRPKWRGKRAHRNAMVLGMKDFLLHRWGQMPS